MLTIEKDVLNMVYEKMKQANHPHSKVSISLKDVLERFPVLKEEPRFLVWDAIATLESDGYIESKNNSSFEVLDFIIHRLTYFGYLRLKELEN